MSVPSSGCGREMGLGGGYVEEWGGSLACLEEVMKGRGIVDPLMSSRTRQPSR
jgi:hypothetical protein